MSREQNLIVLVIATRNAHKAEEIRAILGGNCAFRTLNDFPGAPKVIEDAATFSGNAKKKAAELARWLAGRHENGLAFALADDSGLEVDALGGAPGVHSARFALLDESANPPVENAIDAANNDKLLRLLKDTPAEKRTARFRCVLALTPIDNDVTPRTELFDGVCEGRVSLTPSGQQGFGYDPLFVPLGHEQSFAELGEAIKNKMSHRAKALEKLRGYLALKCPAMPA
jgi:XTP/dITP diphosphohydrolase